MNLSPSARAALEAERLAMVEGAVGDLDHQIVEASRAGSSDDNLDVFVVLAERRLVNDRLTEIERAIAADDSAAPVEEDTVTPGSRISLSIDGDNEVYAFGSLEEGVHGLDVMSPESNFGAVLAGQRAGVSVEVPLPNGRGTLSVSILSIERLP